MYRKEIAIGLLALFIMCFVCGVSVYTDADFQAALQDSQNAQVSNNASAEMPGITAADVSVYAPAIGYFLLFAFLVWVARKIIEADLAVPIFFIICGMAIILFMSYVFIYGDKDGDGQGDSQIIKVIQPTGTDPAMDRQYLTINQQNTKTNMWSAATITIYAAVLLVGMVILTGLGLALNSVKK